MQKAVLYSLWNKELRKVHGVVEDKPMIPGASTQGSYSNFYVRQINGKYDRRVVSPFEGVIYNKCLWLSEENDEKAINSFIDYEKGCILGLQRRIEAHEELIKALEEEIKHGQ